MDVIDTGGGGDCPSPDTTFCDVPKDDTFYHAAEALYAAGITNGCRRDGDKLYFCPDDTLKRQNGMALLARWLYSFDDVADLPSPTYVFPDMTDRDSDDIYLRRIELLYREGEVHGFGDPFGPMQPEDPL